MKIEQVVSLITGGASGLGETCARRMVGAGGKTALLDYNSKRGERIADELGENARFFQADVTDEASMTSAVNGTREAFGVTQ